MFTARKVGYTTPVESNANIHTVLYKESVDKFDSPPKPILKSGIHTEATQVIASMPPGHCLGALSRTRHIQVYLIQRHKKESFPKPGTSYPETNFDKRNCEAQSHHKSQKAQFSGEHPHTIHPLLHCYGFCSPSGGLTTLFH